MVRSRSSVQFRPTAPVFFVFSRGGFFSKIRKGCLFFQGFAQEVSGQCGGLQFGLGFAKTIFLEFGFGKTSTDFTQRFYFYFPRN